MNIFEEHFFSQDFFYLDYNVTALINKEKWEICKFVNYKDNIFEILVIIIVIMKMFSAAHF